MMGIGKHSVLLLLLGLLSCYERQEGCLDLLANNFDATADDPCVDCCTYPDLEVQVKNRLDTLVYSPATLVSNGLGDSFLIIKAGLLLSDFKLENDTGFAEVIDREDFSLFDGTGTIELKDDFLDVATDKGNTRTAGEIKTQGLISGFQVHIGLDASIPALMPGELSDSHPLGSEGGFWEQDQQYSAGFLEILYDTISMDTIRYTLPVSTGFVFNPDTTMDIEYGSDISLKLTLDYLAWTQGINFVEIGENRDSVAKILVGNLPIVISLSD
ncbi:MAG: hypothetical protein HKN16_00205 [Saprospiraceae bacterium]|nr:hypothetical protein [Saprospiraceae bacterium]